MGSSRRPLIMECERGTLIGPDNGLLFPAAQVLGFRRAVHVTEEEYCLPKVSNTFHGRDVFAPVAAHLSLGVSPDSMGGEVEDFVELHFGSYGVSEQEVSGEILYRDRFGNLISNVPSVALPAWIAAGRVVEVELGELREIPFHQNYAAGEPGKPLLTVSSDGFLEIAINRGNASETLKANQGDAFTIRERKARKA